MGKAQRIKKRQNKTPKTAQPARARLGITFYVLCAILIIATLAVYWQVTKFPLINCDDRDYITNNAIVKAGLTKEGLSWAFNVGCVGNWHPLTWMSHMLDSQIFGPGAPEGPGPGGRHMTSLLLHALNTALLFLVLTRMTGYAWRSAFVAALFALHPQHVESVAWVAERKDVLSTLFMMLALWGYAWYAEKPSVLKYVLVALAFALGLLAKPMLVTLPVLMLILDFWPLRRFADGWKWSLVWEKAPLLAMSLASSVVTVVAQDKAGAVRSMHDLNLGERISNSLMSYAIYAVKTVWPSRLGNYYVYPKDGWPATEVIGAALLLAAITCLAILAARKRSYLTVGWLWYVVSLLPVIGLVQVGSQARADRYTYIPIIGLFVMVAWLAPDLLSRIKREDSASPWPGRVLGVVGVAVVAAMGAATYVQIGFWKDGITVARRAIAVTENNWFEEQSLGSQLQDEAEHLVRIGKEAEGIEMARKAAAQLRSSIAHQFGCADSHNDLGRALAVMKDFDGAIKEYHTAIRIHPTHPLAPNNLGNTYLSLGRSEEAIEQYKRTLEIDPRNIYAAYNMGIAFQTRGDNDSAIQQYRRVLELQPNDYFAYWARCNAATLLRGQGETDECVRLLREAIQVNEATGVDAQDQAARMLNAPATR